MFRVKRFISLILACVMCAIFSVPAYAANIDSNYSPDTAMSILNQHKFETKAAELWNVIYENAEDFEVSEDALLAGTIGSPIRAYEYVGTELNQLGFVQYPFIHNNTVEFFFVYDGENVSFSQAFTKEVDVALKENCRVAFVYDAESCYLISGELAEHGVAKNMNTNVLNRINAICLSTNASDDIAYRNSFANMDEVESIAMQEVELVDVATENGLVLSTQAISPYAVSPSIKVTVSTVMQPTSSTCWAACVACIGNALTGKSTSVVTIAKSVFGDNYNQAATDATAMNALYNNYKIRYPYLQNTAPSDSIISVNLSSGKPIYSHWQASNAHHACVIWGIYAPSNSNSVLFLMDPLVGKTTSSKNSNGQYYQVSSSSGTWTMLSFASYCIS